MNVLFEAELGVADLHLPSKACVLYVSECDIIAGSGYKRKLVRYRNVSLGEGAGLLRPLPLTPPVVPPPGLQQLPAAGSGGEHQAEPAVLPRRAEVRDL